MRTLPLRSLLLVVLGLGAALSACDGQGGGSPEELQQALQGADRSEGTSAPAPVANGDPACDALAALPTRQGSLAGWLESAHIAKGVGSYAAPSPAQQGAFQAAFEGLLRDGATPAATAAFDALGFELGGYADDGGAFWLVVEEKAPRTGGGTFVVNPAASRELWLEAPHADSDTGTLKQGASQLTALGARALLLTGANRCAASQATACDGKTAKCGGVLRVSDAAHSEDSYFMAAHRALRAVHPSGLAVNLHGMESDGSEAAVLGDGTKRDNPTAVANALRDALNKRLPAGRKAYSCNDPSDSGQHRDLCGTNNVQGRYDNGSAQACTTAAASSTGRFLHLEQDAQLRGAGAGALIEALAEVVPCTASGQGGMGCAAVPVCR
jgi:hypothetical protein